MCRVPAGALPAGTYTPPTWLDALAGGNAGAVLPPAAPNASVLASTTAAAVAAAAAPQQLHVPLPTISDAELSMLDSLLNVKVEGTNATSAAATQLQQLQQPQQPAMKPAAATAPAAFVAPPPPAFLANVFPGATTAAPSGGLPYGAITHANASTYAAHASQLLDNRGKRVKKVRLFFFFIERNKILSPGKEHIFFRSLNRNPPSSCASAPLSHLFSRFGTRSATRSVRSVREESESRRKGPPRRPQTLVL